MNRKESNSTTAAAARHHSLTTSIILVIGASLCFANSYNGDFVFDDSEAIVKNEDVRGATPLNQLFANDFWGTSLLHKQSHKSYRPLTVLSFRLHYWLKGHLDPADFHAVNVVLHSVVSVVTLFVFEILLDWQAPQVSFNAAMLFAVHPIHAEAVSGIVGRADILCGLFMWLSVVSYYKCVHSQCFIVKCVCMMLSVVNCAVAMFCKETGIAVLGICVTYDLIVANKILPADFLQIIRLKNMSDDVKKFLPSKSFLIRMTVLTLAGVLLVLLRLRIMEFSKPVFKPVDNPASFIDNSLLRIINYHYIYWLNFWLLLCPDWLCFDWSMGCVPIIYGPDPRIVFVLLLWIVFGALIKTVFSDKNDLLARHVSIALALLVIPFLPASNVFFTVGFVLAERTLYVPSAGYCLLIAIGFQRISNSIDKPRAMSAAYCALLFLMSIRSWIRSEQWKTETTLFQSGLSVCPLNAKVHYNVAKNAADRGFVENAKLMYEEAIRLNPEYAQAMNNLGNLYKNENNYVKAEKLLRQAVKIQNDFSAAWMNLGIVLSASNRYKEAEKCYITAITHRSKYPDCYYNLGLLYLEIKNHDKALKSWEIAIKQKPTHRQAWTNMIILHDSLGKHTQALKVGSQALMHVPHDSSLHFNVGNVLGKQGSFQEAEHHFQTAIFLDPTNYVYYTNLGVLYHRWKKFDKAEIMYKKSLELNPSSLSIKENLQKLKNSKSQQQ
ncbi:transmembrane and TPR repeat-containing protein 4 [Copidosoma floridanum]|uniref:transmembrane and TPR repeat-containing protein 4 n=1 Tax=Copidosoma floridanum TaxID=29053 RepID=UPI0006C9DE34|nr:transmembrane and TPR repeat-containing protein 4 [Copidosoma floridanum]